MGDKVLGEVAVINMGQSPKGDSYNELGQGKPLLNGPTEFGPYHPSPKTWTSTPTKLCKQGDLLFCVRGSTTGRMNWADQEYCLGRGLAAFSAKSGSRADTKYLYYSLVYALPSLLGLSAGSVFPNLSQKDFAGFEIGWPTEKIRYTIADLLGSLDDKIELNRRMNATLESMARAMFKAWFMGNEKSGEWRIGKLCEIASFAKGVSYRSADLVEESETALVTLKSMGRGGGYREDGLKPFVGKYKPEQRVFPGEIVVAQTDLTQAADVIGRAARVEPNENHPILVASLDLVIVRPKNGFTTEYLNGVLSRSEFSDHAYGYTNGTTVLHLSSKALPEYGLTIPPFSVVAEYTKMVSPIYSQIDNNNGQSRALAALRDALLPRLMSGEVRVGER